MAGSFRSAYHAVSQIRRAPSNSLTASANRDAGDGAVRGVHFTSNPALILSRDAPGTYTVLNAASLA
jgi:hypothetical protein